MENIVIYYRKMYVVFIIIAMVDILMEGDSPYL